MGSNLRFRVLGFIVVIALMLVYCGKDSTPVESKGPEPGVEWTEQTSGVGVKLSAVAWSGTHFIAVGDSGTIISSPDGIIWTVQVSGTSKRLVGVAWVGDEFIAVGDSGTILLSDDGISWTADSSPIADRLFGVTSSDTLRVIVGYGGTILTSQTGSDWQVKTSPYPYLLVDVVWNGQKFLAVGPQAVIVSDDGELWDLATNELGMVTAACWTGSEYLAVGIHAFVVASPDGETWSLRAMYATGGNPYAIVSTGTQFVMVGGLATSILTSNDSKVWTPREVENPVQMMDIVWSGEKFVTVGEHGRILTSP